MVLTTSWTTGLIFGLAAYSLRSLDIKHLFTTIILLVLNASFFVTAVTTYSYIFHKLFNRRTLSHKNSRENSLNNPPQNSRRHKLFGKFYFEAGFIMLSSIIFGVIPSSVKYLVYYPDIYSFEYHILSATYFVNYVAHPCIYIFLEPLVRKLLKNKITMCLRAGEYTTSINNKQVRICIIRDQRQLCELGLRGNLL